MPTSAFNTEALSLDRTGALLGPRPQQHIGQDAFATKIYAAAISGWRWATVMALKFGGTAIEANDCAPS